MTEGFAPQVLDLVPEPIIVEFPAFRLEEWYKKIGVADRRLERAGLPPFKWHLEHFDKKVRKGGVELEDGTLFGGIEAVEPWIRVHLDELTISAGHYTFVAALVAEEAGYTVHAAPGQNLDGWVRPPVDDIHCDHCGTKRDRKRLYIIRDDRDGSLVQVGHSCIELYTGLKLKGLWALTYGPELRAFGGEGDGGSGRDYLVPVDRVLGLAFSLADEGKSYVSVKAADFGKQPTAAAVRLALYGRVQPPQRKWFKRDSDYQKALDDYHAFLEKIRRGIEFSADADLIADIRKAADALAPGTDYADNMHTILAGENVSYRNIGILASLVAVYAKEKELAVKREQEKKAPPAKGLLAPVKTRLRGLEITLDKVKAFEGQYGTRTLLSGRTDTNHVVVWWATGDHTDYEPGDLLTIDATVDRLDPWQPRSGEAIDQTVVKNGRIKGHVSKDAVG